MQCDIKVSKRNKKKNETENIAGIKCKMEFICAWYQLSENRKCRIIMQIVGKHSNVRKWRFLIGWIPMIQIASLTWWIFRIFLNHIQNHGEWSSSYKSSKNIKNTKDPKIEKYFIANFSKVPQENILINYFFRISSCLGVNFNILH